MKVEVYFGLLYKGSEPYACGHFSLTPGQMVITANDKLFKQLLADYPEDFEALDEAYVTELLALDHVYVDTPIDNVLADDKVVEDLLNAFKAEDETGGATENGETFPESNENPVAETTGNDETVNAEETVVETLVDNATAELSGDVNTNGTPENTETVPPVENDETEETVPPVENEETETPKRGRPKKDS